MYAGVHHAVKGADVECLDGLDHGLQEASADTGSADLGEHRQASCEPLLGTSGVQRGHRRPGPPHKPGHSSAGELWHDQHRGVCEQPVRGRRMIRWRAVACGHHGRGESSGRRAM